jgi:hypothetical protein
MRPILRRRPETVGSAAFHNSTLRRLYPHVDCTVPDVLFMRCKMSLRFFVCLTTMTVLLGATGGRAQNADPLAGLPDACKLMPQSDLEALFPGMSVTNTGTMLSVVYEGPQWHQGCSYSVKLPSPTSKMFFTNIISLTVIKCGLCNAKDKSDSLQALAAIRDTQEKVVAAATPSLHLQLEPLSDVGDDSFEESKSFEHQLYVRKDDLIFILTVPKYSQQTQPNAVALARQVAKRWRGGVGMVEAATPIAANSAVDVPPDERELTKASPDKWPNACRLLTPDDVRAVFSDMTIGKQERTMGQIKIESRVDRVEALPHPISCGYTAHKITTVNGQRQTVTNTIALNVWDVATTIDFAKKYYKIAADKDNPVPGLGDEASIDKMNRIYIRKDVLTISVYVGGNSRDQELYDDARRRANELAKLVAAKLPSFVPAPGTETP